MLKTIQTLTIYSSLNPTDAFQRYQSLTGASLDPTTGLLTITSSQYDNLRTLSFNIGGTSYNLTPNAQLWPRSLNGVMGGNSSSIYLVVNDIGFPDELAFDFINGYCFLYDFVSIYVFWSSHLPCIANATTAYLTLVINALESLKRYTHIRTQISSFHGNAECMY